MADMLPLGGHIRINKRDQEIDAAAAARDAAPTSLGEKGLAFAEGIARDNYTSRWVRENVQIGNPLTEDFLTFHDQPTFEPDEDYRFEDDELNYGYEPSMMVSAKSAEEAAYFRKQIDREMGQLEQINRSAWGTVGQAYGGIFQPHVAAAIAAAPVSIPAMIALEGAGEVMSEALLHEMEKTRTMEESALNVGLTVATVGILGGAASWMSKSSSGTIKPDIIDEINSGSFGGDTAGAARALGNDITAAEDELVGGKFAKAFSVGQMQKLLYSASDSARGIIQKLADNPFFTKGMAQGKTHGVTAEALQEAAMGRVVIAADAVNAMRKPSGLSKDEFNHQIGIAMSNGDKHANPHVAKAAEHYRKEVLDPIREASERLGLLENIDELKVKIDELEVTVKDMTAGAKDIKVKAEGIETARAKYVSSREKALAKLTKAVETSQAKLDKIRAPGADGKPRRATKEQVTKHNETRNALTLHRTETAGKVSEYRASAKELRTQKQDLARARKDLREAKTKAATGVFGAESYFPRIYNKEAIYENWDALKFQLEELFRANPKIMGKLESGEITEMAIDTLQNMVGARSQAITGRGVPSPLRARVLGLMDNELEKYLEKNATDAMIRHAQSMQPYLIIRDAFDGRTMDEMMSLIDDDYKILLNKAADGKERAKLAKAHQADKDNLKVVHDRLMHQVQRSVNPRGAAEKVTQFAKVWNTATYLGGVVFSSLPDLARPMANYGMRSFGKGLAKGFSQLFAGKGSMQSVQVKRTGAALQRTLNDRMQQLTDSLEPMGKVTGGMQKFWEKSSMFGVWTDVMESVAAHSAMDWTLRMAKRSLDGKTIGKADTRQLARMGLNAEDLALIARESEGTMGMQDTVLKYMNTMEWQDVDLAKRVEAAIGSDVRRTIIRIGAAEKPAFMDGTTWSAILQFQTFAMSAQNKIMVAGMQNLATVRTAQSLVAMTTLGAMVGAGKATLRGDDVSKWPPGKWVTEGVDRSGMSGILRIPMNMLLYAGAQTDMGQGTFGEPSRFLEREVEGALLGPTISVLGNMTRAGMASIAGDQGKAGEHLWKAAPFGNIWHYRNILQRLGE